MYICLETKPNKQNWSFTSRNEFEDQESLDQINPWKPVVLDAQKKKY